MQDRGTKKRIAVVPGDGIGKEVIPQAVNVIRAAGAAFEFTEFDWSADRYLRDGTTIPQDGFSMLERDFDAVLVGGSRRVSGEGLNVIDDSAGGQLPLDFGAPGDVVGGWGQLLSTDPTFGSQWICFRCREVGDFDFDVDICAYDLRFRHDPIDAASADRLKDLLGAVAVYAAGGYRALADYSDKKGGEVLRLTTQLKGS